MLSPTLEKGLRAYEIGPRIRALRLKKKIGLVELGQHTGLSPALLSKLERERLYPTLPTLLRIALVFGVGLEHFFAGSRDKPVLGIVRRKERMRFPGSPDGREQAFQFECLDFTATERRFNAYLAEFFPLDASGLPHHEHAGGELIFVLSGTLSVHVGGEEHVLGTGDSMYFDSSVPHGYRRSRGPSCRALVVTSG